MYEIRESKIQGKGVFAKSDIPKNFNLGIAFKKINDTGNPDDDYERTKLGEYVNHSSVKNNLSYLADNKDIFFIAKNNIKREEELLINYKDFFWEGKRDFK